MNPSLRILLFACAFVLAACSPEDYESLNQDDLLYELNLFNKKDDGTDLLYYLGSYDGHHYFQGERPLQISYSGGEDIILKKFKVPSENIPFKRKKHLRLRRAFPIETLSTLDPQTLNIIEKKHIETLGYNKNEVYIVNWKKKSRVRNY